MANKVPKKVDAQTHRKDFVSASGIGSILGIAAYEALKAIVGFITLWFFRPFWSTIVEKWNLRKQKKIEESPKVDVDPAE